VASPGNKIDMSGFAKQERQQWIAAERSDLPTTAQLQQWTAQVGLDQATVRYYQAVIASPLHRDLRAHLDNPAPCADPDIKVIIAPALFYAERPEFGGDGRQVIETARRFGYAVERAPLLSRGSITANAERLWQQIEAEAKRPLWLVSLSIGGAAVRLALQQQPDHPAWRKVQGWINVSGLVAGTPLADGYGWAMRTFFLLAGVDPRTATELHPNYPPWQAAWQPPSHLRVINVIGVPLRHHLRQRNVRWRYARLARFGPNDGMAPLPALLVQPGWVYPIWGADHFLQTPAVQPVLAGLFAHLGAFSR
jgi:hypothetical protein